LQRTHRDISREISHYEHGDSGWSRYSTNENLSQNTNDVIDSEITKPTLLYIREDDLLWKGDLESLKKFIEADIQLSERWSSPRGGTIQFSNLEFCLKWHGPTENKLSIIQDNEDNQLLTTLKSYATVYNETNERNLSKNVPVNDTTEDEAVINSKHSTCEECKNYKEEL
jgi:hypothetical protein